MYTILGSGFGLYGYLPALLRRDNPAEVVLPRAYLEKAAARPELSDCIPRVRWLADRDECLGSARSVIVCLPPAPQATACDALSALSNVETVILEKPVARNPTEAAKVLDVLTGSGKTVTVNYSFIYLAWYDRFKALIANARETETVSITWKFRAHHFRHGLRNWKRTPADGGGVLRFYGIHLIALLASLDYDAVSHSRVERSGREEDACWRAAFVRPGGPRVDVLVDSNADTTLFDARPANSSTAGVALQEPFADERFTPKHPADDRRIGPLTSMLERASDGADAMTTFYQRVNALWALAEEHPGTRS